MNFEYGFTDAINKSFPKGTKWFPKGKKYLTYGFLRESEIPLNMITMLTNAFTRWSQTTRVLNFRETTSYNDTNIKIGFYNINYNEEVVDDVVGGNSFISLKLDSNVKSGVIQLEASKYWVLPTDTFIWLWELQQFNLEIVVMHQIRHLLGLDHSFDQEFVMYPTIFPTQQRKVQISVSDNLAIQKLYTSPIKLNSNSHYRSGLFTSLSIEFAFVALLN